MKEIRENEIYLLFSPQFHKNCFEISIKMVENVYDVLLKRPKFFFNSLIFFLNFSNTFPKKRY